MFFYTKRKTNYGQESNIRCFVANYTRDGWGGIQKVTNDDKGEGVTKPPKTLFMNSP